MIILVKLPYLYQKRDIALVLPHTFFLDGYSRYKGESTLTHIENLAKVTLIAEFIARKKAFYPNTWSAATSEVAFRRFEDNLGEASYFSKLNLSSIKDALLVDDEPDLNKLKPIEETVIAVANKILKTYALNPIIVVRNDSVNKWKNTYIKDFYKRHTSKKDRLAVLSVDDTLKILKEKHKPLFESSKDSISDIFLKLAIERLGL